MSNIVKKNTDLMPLSMKEEEEDEVNVHDACHAQNMHE